MLNPHSAVSIIKNQLAYKLGSCMIEHNANGGGYLSLIKKLYKIKKEYFKERKLYKQTIKIFPNLTYPDIKTLNDYNDSIKLKFHLSYMLGQTLIQADKDKFKGGYLKLFKNIKQTKKDYKIIKQLLSNFNIISPIVYNTIADNKTLFINNFENIKDILNTHKDYQAIIDNIFHNFNYFLNHLDLIKEWLLSNDFNERYKKENHPYPSLLDPKKLNDENEEINYNNIPAELAWEMNLPLPDRYEFVFLLIHGAGTSAMTYYLKLCGINSNRHYGDPIYQFIDSYNTLLNNGYNIVTLAGRDYNKKNDINKFYSLIQKRCPAICVVRDPISVLKPMINHFGILDKTQIKDNVKIFSPLKELFDIKISYCNMDKNGEIDISTLISFSQDYDDYNILGNKIQKLKNITNILYIDMEEIKPDKAINTLNKLSKKLEFKMTEYKDCILNFTNSSNDYIDFYFFPKRFYILDDKDNKIFFYLEKETNKDEKFINYIKYFTDIKMFYNKRICMYINKFDFMNIKNTILWDNICEYFKTFFILLERFYINERNKIKSEKDILDFMKHNSYIAINFKNKFDKDYKHLKQHRPDIVASWKYYQEFEKMCEELDEKEKLNL